jgi:manganese oxidase
VPLDANETPEPTETPSIPTEPAESRVDQVTATTRFLSRRGFLRTSALAGGGLVAASVAACAGATAPQWSFGPAPAPGTPKPANPTGAPTSAPGGSPTPAAATATPGGVTLPAGWSDHDLKAQIVVRRFVGNLSGPLGLGDLLDEPLGAPTEDPEFTKLPHGNQPLEPTLDGDVKVFDLTVDEIEWPIDAEKPPVKALGYNRMWPGPILRVVEGDRVRARFTNNLPETTGIHFHGVEFDDFRQDGIPFLTQLPIKPGETFTYEFVARNAGSHMYHSHHNATDQVGRGLLGAFIVDPKNPDDRYDRKFGVTQDIVFIHNDALGGFTINGHGFPGTMPIVAKKGEKILIRYMNEGLMMHPWHTHGFRQRIVARDGWPLGSAEFDCDTLGVNPGERFDAIVDCDRVGVWALHCHVLSHVEGLDGMFGMVTALVVLPE